MARRIAFALGLSNYSSRSLSWFSDTFSCAIGGSLYIQESFYYKSIVIQMWLQLYHIVHDQMYLINLTSQFTWLRISFIIPFALSSGLFWSFSYQINTLDFCISVKKSSNANKVWEIGIKWIISLIYWGNALIEHHLNVLYNHC